VAQPGDAYALQDDFTAVALRARATHNPSMTQVAEPRALTCARCGAAFACGSTVGTCWCAEEDFRLPMPTGSAEDCLCPPCLRKAAAERRMK
jgi:hypothetical protein